MRFRFNNDKWAEYPNSVLFSISSKKNHDGKESLVLSASQEKGMIPRNKNGIDIKYSEESVFTYKIIENGDYVIHLRSFQGGFAFSRFNGICSPAYTVLKPNKEILSNGFLENYFTSKKFIDSLRTVTFGIRDGKSISVDQWMTQSLFIPSKNEQEKIIAFIQKINSRIEVQNKIISDLKVLKKELCNKVFSKGSVVRLGDFIEEVTTRNKSNSCENVLSVSNKMGFIKQSEQFEDRTVASENKSNYKVVTEGCFAYNPARINVGSIALLSTYKIGIISPMYVCFKTKNTLNSEYLNFYYQSGFFYKELQKKLEGSVRQCLTYKNMSDILIPYVDIEKQKAIAATLNKFATLIANEEKYLKLLQKQKSYFLNAMFV